MAMICPVCEASMEKGKVSLNSSFLRSLAVGYSWSKLDFQKAGDGKPKPIRIMDQGESITAFRCGNCGIVTLLPAIKPTHPKPVDW